MKQIDRYDIMIVAGVVLTTVGLWIYEPVLLLVAGGLALVKAGMRLARPVKGA